MGVYLLFAAGLLFALLLALNNLIKTVFRRFRIGFVDTLLAFLTTLVPLASLILAQLDADVDRRLPLAVLLLGGGLAGISLIILLLELFRPQRLRGSRGVLGLFSGLLLIAAVFIVPISAEALLPATPTVVVNAVSAVTTDEADALLSPTPRVTLAPTATNAPATHTPAPTATPIPATRTPSRTPFRFSTRTPTPTPTLVTPCVASVQYNLRLRAAPNREAETLLTIPYGTSIELYARGDASENDARWWYARYENRDGWVDGQFMLVSRACDALPFREAP